MIDRIAVVIPAADEQDTIGSCLSALSNAVAAAGCPVRTIVVLDACTDRTADIAANFAGVELVRSGARSVGQARRAGVGVAIAGDPHLSGLLIASTDADSIVPTSWLARLRAMAATTDLVVGTVVPDDDLLGDVEAAWYAAHDLHEGHPHVHAANLAIRADAYLLLGGWRPITTGEDVDLVNRAVDAGLRIARTAAVPVLTSTRAEGRAPHGFSSYLRALGHV